MPYQSEEDLDKAFLARHKAQQEGVTAGYQHSPSNAMLNPKPIDASTLPGQGESALRGAASGATFGFYPQIAGGLSSGFGLTGDYEKEKADAQRKQDLAYETNPNSYRTGYGTGAIGSTIATGGLGELGLAARGGMAARAAAMAPKATQAITKGAQMFNAPIKAGISASQGTRAAGSATNSPSIQNFIDNMTGKDREGPGSKANTDNKQSSFQTLSDYLRQTPNPQVAAMNMQRTPEGRAQFNEESPLHDEEDDELA